MTQFKKWRHLFVSSSSWKCCKHRFQLSLHIFCGHKGELFNLLHRLDAVNDCTESTNCKNLFQETILQAHVKSRFSCYKFLVWSFAPSARDQWLQKWPSRLEQVIVPHSLHGKVTQFGTTATRKKAACTRATAANSLVSYGQNYHGPRASACLNSNCREGQEIHQLKRAAGLLWSHTNQAL